MALGRGGAFLDLDLRSVPPWLTAYAPVWVDADVIRRQAVIVGGLAAGSADDRLSWGRGCVEQMEASLEPRSGFWSPTALYLALESSEKAGASYRIGSTLAGVLSEFIATLLIHRQWVFGATSRTRGDYIGWSPLWRGLAGVEAKGRAASPDGPTLVKAKGQASTVGADLAARGYARARADWAFTSVVGRVRVRVVVDDPPPDEPVAAAGDDGADADDRLLAGHYRTFIALVETMGVDTAPGDAGVEAVGAVLPGTDLWVGVESELAGPILAADGLRDALRRRARTLSSQQRERNGLDGYVVRRLSSFD